MGKLSVKELRDRNWIIENEADQWTNTYANLSNWNGSSAPSATTYGTPFYSKLLPVPAGQTANLRSVTVSSDGPCVFSYHVSKGGFVSTMGAYNTGLTQKSDKRGTVTFGANGGQHIVTFGGGEGFDVYENGGLLVSFFAVGTTQPIVSLDIDAPLYTADANFGAKNLWLSIGDSITWTAMGNEASTFRVNYGDTHYTSRVANILRAQNNFDLRVSRRGFGGALSNQWYDYIKSGALDRSLIEHYDPRKTRLLATIGLGSNDAAVSAASVAIASTTSSTYQTTYRTRLETIISHIYKRCPNASVIVLGPPDSDLADRSANVPGYRTVAAQIVTEGLGGGGLYVDKDLKYHDQSVGLTVNDTNYTEQGANTHLHPRGDTGHAIIATGNVNGQGTTGLLATVKTTNFYLNNVVV